MELVLITAINSVFPIILLILFGVFLKSTGMIDNEFAIKGNKLVFNYFLPCSLFINVYGIDSIDNINWNFVLYCLAVVFLLFVTGIITAIFSSKDPKKRGVIVQCVFRSNSAIIGLPLANALGGETAAAVASIVLAATIPLYNILAVISLSIFNGNSSDRSKSFKKIIREIVKNPLIRGICVGFVCILIRHLQVIFLGSVALSIIENIRWFYSAINNISSLTTPFALIVIGATLKFTAAKGMLREIVIGSLWRVVFAPIIGIGGALVLTRIGLLSCGVNEYPTLIAILGTPVAVSSAVMASQMGNDEQLATQYVFWTSVSSAFTILIIVSSLMMMGMLQV